MTQKELVAAISNKCLDCSYGNNSEVDNCPITSCPLYEYRNNQARQSKKRKVEMTEERRLMLSERMKEYRRRNKQ